MSQKKNRDFKRGYDVITADRLGKEHIGKFVSFTSLAPWATPELVSGVLFSVSRTGNEKLFFVTVAEDKTRPHMSQAHALTVEDVNIYRRLPVGWNHVKKDETFQGILEVWRK